MGSRAATPSSLAGLLKAETKRSLWTCECAREILPDPSTQCRSFFVLVNTLEKASVPEFSCRVFVLAFPLGSQNKSFSFKAPPTKHASCRAAAEPGPFCKFTHPYPNLPIRGRRGPPSFPPVRCQRSLRSPPPTHEVPPSLADENSAGGPVAGQQRPTFGRRVTTFKLETPRSLPLFRHERVMPDSTPRSFDHRLLVSLIRKICVFQNNYLEVRRQSQRRLEACEDSA